MTTVNTTTSTENIADDMTIKSFVKTRWMCRGIWAVIALLAGVVLWFFCKGVKASLTGNVD